MIDAVLTALLGLPVYHADRDMPEADRTAMVRDVAEAIVAEARNIEEMAFGVSQAGAESQLAAYVLQGRCVDGPRGAQCDPDKHGKPRAVGPWQVHPAHCKTADTLRGQFRCALKMARYGRTLCRNGWLGAFSVQRGTGTCQWSQSAARVRVMRESLQRIQRATWEARP